MTATLDSKEFSVESLLQMSDKIRELMHESLIEFGKKSNEAFYQAEANLKTKREEFVQKENEYNIEVEQLRQELN